MKKIQVLIIINPISGVYRKEHIPEKIARYIDYTKYDYAIRATQYAGHATELAKQAVEEGFKLVVAVGGDGSINEVANALIGTDVALGLIPFGSGNGLALHLGIKPRDAKFALNILNTGKIVKIDSIETNIKSFISSGGLGFDAHAARRFRSQSIRGFFSYFLAGAREIFWNFKPSTVKFTIDNETIERETYLFTAFNSSQYGYNFGVFPNTSIKDGIMDVILLNSFPLRRLFYIFFCLVFKRPDLVKEAECFRAKEIIVHGNKKIVYQLDGDHYILHEDLYMKIKPQSLHIIVPASLSSF
jgi:YegS/Rv2252/BmrU family lipid kinase